MERIMNNGLEFDPGFAPYVMAFQGTVEYLYADINRFKNFSQRKLKFRQYYKKILEVFNNNAGFYIGCLMWAAYIKTQPEQALLNNHCLGKEFIQSENTTETDFMLKFTELFPKDMKYFLNEHYDFDSSVINLLNIYKEFLNINKGFVDAKNNVDIKLPEQINPSNAESYKEKIDKVINSKNLSNFLEYIDTIFK